MKRLSILSLVTAVGLVIPAFAQNQIVVGSDGKLYAPPTTDDQVLTEGDGINITASNPSGADSQVDYDIEVGLSNSPTNIIRFDAAGNLIVTASGLVDNGDGTCTHTPGGLGAAPVTFACAPAADGDDTTQSLAVTLGATSIDITGDDGGTGSIDLAATDGCDFTSGGLLTSEIYEAHDENEFQTWRPATDNNPLAEITAAEIDGLAAIPGVFQTLRTYEATFTNPSDCERFEYVVHHSPPVISMVHAEGAYVDIFMDTGGQFRNATCSHDTRPFLDTGGVGHNIVCTPPSRMRTGSLAPGNSVSFTVNIDGRVNELADPQAFQIVRLGSAQFVMFGVTRDGT